MPKEEKTLLIKRRRGAQPGNFNALKHGVYSAQLKSPEIVDLDLLMDSDLKQEIAMLRSVMRRALIVSVDYQGFDDTIRLLNALAFASGRLATLLRVQNLIGSHSDAAELIAEAFTAVLQELNIQED